MNNKWLYIVLAACALSACTSLELPFASDLPEVIEVAVTVGSQTKAAAQPYTETVPSSSSPLVADIWFSTTSGHYAGNTISFTSGVSQDGTTIDSHRTITYTSGAPTMPSGIEYNYLRYPSADGTVYCVGFYPQGIWSNNAEGTTASASIDGTTDVMFAKEISGTNSDKLTYKPQTFEHLLTLVKVRVHAGGDEAAETWGKIKKITVHKENSVNINLGTGVATFTGDTEYELFTGLTAFSPTSAELGSALLAPAVADGGSSAEYTFHVECENHSKDVPVSLVDADGNSFSGSTAGKVFVVTLNFLTLDYVNGTTSIEKWDEEYQDITLQ